MSFKNDQDCPDCLEYTAIRENNIVDADATSSNPMITGISTDIELPNQALLRENLTEKVLANLEKRAIGLTVDGVDDKAGFALVRGTRLEAKGLRTRTVKVCKSGREDAVKVQKQWIAAEKKITDRLDAVMNPLQAEEDRINRIVENERREREEATFKRVTDRVAAFASVGITMDFIDARDMGDEEYADTLASATFFYEGEQAEAKIETERLDAVRIEEERLAQIKADEEAAERDALYEKAKADATEFVKAQADLRIAQEELERQRRLIAKQQAGIDAERVAAEQAAAFKDDFPTVPTVETPALSDSEILLSLAHNLDSFPIPNLRTPHGFDISVWVAAELADIATAIRQKVAKL